MDQIISIVTQQQEKGVYVAQFKTHDLAIFTYYVESNKECYIIDPPFDSNIFKDFLKKRGSTLKYVVLTHYHADFLSAHVDLGVPIIMGEKSKRSVNKFEIRQMKDNEKFKIGNVETRVLATPGHTTQSACYILSNQEGHQFCIFTGDTVFLRQVGRPDLAVASDITSADLAGMLFDSIKKIKALNKNLRIYPGHGSGSSCGKSIGSGNFCTLGVQHQKNYGFLIQDRNQFIQKVTEGLPTPPKYFFHDAKLNQQGSKTTYSEILKKCKKPLSAQDFKGLIDKKKNIIDSRHNVKNGLIEGSYWMTIKGDIANWISMLIKPEEQFAVITEPGKQEQIIERFIRIGYFNILGYNAFDAQTWNLTKLHVLTLKTYEQLDKTKKYVHLDVRNLKEWEDMGTFEDAVLISLPNLMNEIKQVQRYMAINQDSDLVVNCKTGGRARLAASILLKNGIHPIVLNQNLDNLKQKGFKMTEFKAPIAKDGGCCTIF